MCVCVCVRPMNLLCNFSVYGSYVFWYFVTKRTWEWVSFSFCGLVLDCVKRILRILNKLIPQTYRKLTVFLWSTGAVNSWPGFMGEHQFSILAHFIIEFLWIWLSLAAPQLIWKCDDVLICCSVNWKFSNNKNHYHWHTTVKDPALHVSLKHKRSFIIRCGYIRKMFYK